MSIHNKVAAGYAGVQGGLFAKVTKADVGDNFASLAKNNVTLMGWADPFYPNPSIPEKVKRVMIEALEGGFPSHYILPIGDYALREAVAKKCMSFNKFENVDPGRNVIITPGSDSGLYYAMSIFISPGDEVLVPDPSYPNNFLNPKLLGGKTVPVPLHKESGYHFDMDAFERAVTPKTKMVVLTHPNNPTTTVFRRQELEQLADFVIRHDLILVVDQAFEDIVYDDVEFVSPAALPGMWERTVTVCSISKGMGLSGFRVGYIVASDEMMDIYYGAAVSVLGATNTVAQIGALAAFEDPGFIEAYKAHFDYRRKEAYRIFNGIENVSMFLPECGFFSWIDVSKLGNSNDIMEFVLTHAKVAVNDGKNYGQCGDGCLRIIHGCLLDDGEAVAAMERIGEALRVYNND